MSETVDRRELLKDALRAVEQMRERLAAVERAATEPIAIVGIGSRLPAAADGPDAFWALLEAGGDAVTEAPEDRMPRALLAERLGDQRVYGGFLDRIGDFDAHFFGIAPREALTMDPQHRLVLETTWEALEHAGIAVDALRGTSTGVFIGITAIDYPMHLRRSDRAPLDAYFATGSAHNAAAGRVSYLFGLQGPSMAIDTACSSSLTAVHLACQSLRLKESQLAIAGGVNTLVIADWFEALSRWGMLCGDGRCKAFDASADGIGRSEGCGIVILKRVSDAVADGDRILGVIRGSAVNQDGASSGLTAPNGPAQEAVIRQALRVGGVKPADVGYVEAHGTGTPLGDPIELEALHAVFAEGRDAAHPLVVGSAKTNLGHLEAAAGVTGLIKLVLALQHERIPRHLHYSALNPNVSLRPGDIQISVEAMDWPGGHPHVGGVSSFGISGTNAHVVVAEAPAVPPRAPSRRQAFALTLSARSPEALGRQAARWRDAFRRDRALEPRDVARTANFGRSALPWRAAVVGSTLDDFSDQLDLLAGGQPLTSGRTGHVKPSDRPRVVMLFTGQGSQYHGMSRELYATQPAFRAALDRCDSVLREVLNRSILEVMHGDGVDPTLIDQTAFTQPALFAFEYALYELWRTWGVEPAAVAGHSVGEYVAACVAGVFSLEDGLRLIAARGRLMQALPSGGEMAAVLSSEAVVRARLSKYPSLSIAAVNGPEHTVIAGAANDLRAVVAEFERDGVSARPLTVSHAFHSALMDPMLAEFREVASRIAFQPPQLPLAANLTGTLWRSGVAPDAEYWTSHLRQAVRFADDLLALDAAGFSIYLEVGPVATLTGMAWRVLDATRTVTLASVRRERSAWHELMLSAGALFTLGVPVRWREIEAGDSAQTVSLPTYPFERQHYWVTPAAASTPVFESVDATAIGHPLLGRRLPSPLKTVQFEQALSASAPSFLGDHVIRGAALFPGTGYLEIALAAGAAIVGDEARTVQDLALLQPLVLPDADYVRVQTIVTGGSDGSALVEIHSASGTGADTVWTLHASATVRTGGADLVVENLDEARKRCVEAWPAEALYEWFSRRGVDYGPTFRNIADLWRGNGEVVGRLRWASGVHAGDPFIFHPAIADACLQLLAALAGDAAWYVPVNIASVTVLASPARAAWVHGTLHPASADGSMSGDLRLYDEDGAPIATLLGFRARPATGDLVAERTRYRVCWSPADAALADAALATPRSLAGTWILVPDGGQEHAIVAAAMAAAGATVSVVPDPTREAISGAITHAGQEFRGVVHLCGLDDAAVTTPSPAALQRTTQTVFDTIAGILDAAPSSSQFCLVTRGAQAAADDASVRLNQSPSWALVRSAAMEHPELHPLSVDLDPEAGSIDPGHLIALLSQSREPEVVVRDGSLSVRRLERVDALARAPLPQAYRLDIEERGRLDRLTIRPLEPSLPGYGQVALRVTCSGLNFRDVLNALGMFRGDGGALGAECVGFVTAVGDGVDHVRVGDEVLGMVSGSLASHAVVAADLVVVKPSSLSPAAAATIPLAFLTVEYCLARLAGMRRGDRVLIHAATGGVGLAAIQLAKQAGAEIYATAGSPRKRALLRALGVEHVFSSRTLDFADEIKARTAGQGVDIVLNSLNGAFIDRSVEILAPGGRFVEIGNTDIWTSEQMTLRRPDVAYFVVYLGTVDPPIIREMLHSLMERFASGVLQSLPRTVYPIQEAADAFRLMAQARHIGKIALVCDAAAMTLPAEGRYLITGGFGGLGLRVARHLVERGARHLALVGRSGLTSPEAVQDVEALRAAGADVRCFQADVAEPGAVARILADLEPGPPLRGVVHAAGVVADATVEDLEWDQFERVFAAKVYGTWQLHEATRDLGLDFFVMFSSASAVMGAAGQSNYAAANAYLDAMAHHRRSLALPAVSISWGPWDSAGMAAALDEVVLQRWRRAGIDLLSESEALSIFDEALDADAATVCALRVNWRRYADALSSAPPVFLERVVARPSPMAPTVPEARVPALLRELDEAPANSRLTIIGDYVRHVIRQVLAVDARFTIAAAQGLRELGMDSLMSVELRNHLQSAIDRRLPSTLAFDCPTVGDLTAYLADLLIDDLPAAEPTPPQQPNGLNELLELSDDEAEALLARELEK